MDAIVKQLSAIAVLIMGADKRYVAATGLGYAIRQARFCSTKYLLRGFFVCLCESITRKVRYL